MKRGLVFRIWI